MIWRYNTCFREVHLLQYNIFCNTRWRDSLGTYAHPMNDLTTAFAVPKSEGNARAEDVSKHSAVSRGEIAECSCEVVGRAVR